MSYTDIFVTPALAEVLDVNGIDVRNYGPAYGGESAALDLYYVGKEPLILAPEDASQKVLIPTGLHIALPKGRVALLRERGSVSKTNLVLRAGVIDAGYTGEIFVNAVSIYGWGEIAPQSKLPFQLLVVPVFNEFNVIQNTDDWNELVKDSVRRGGRVGSSD